jgi:hypothetical protein
MIDRTEFDTTIKEASLLITGKPPTQPFADAVYKRINPWFTHVDLQKAAESLMSQEGARLTYPALHKLLVHHRAHRLEEQNQAEKARDRMFADNMETHNPELYAMLEAVISKDTDALKRYGLDVKYPFSNAVLITRDGWRRKIVIDDKQPGFSEMVDVIRVPGGESASRQITLNTSKAKFMYTGKAPHPDEHTGWKATRLGDLEGF